MFFLYSFISNRYVFFNKNRSKLKIIILNIYIAINIDIDIDITYFYFKEYKFNNLLQLRILSSSLLGS